MIQIENLRKSYGEIVALEGISVSIDRGKIVGLLGPNGAGKTTMMKILVGYLIPDSGSASVAGIDVLKQPMEVQQRIGYLPENAPVYGDMLVQEYLAFVAQMRGLEGRQASRRIGEAAEQCAVERVLNRTIGHLSKGYRQRVGLAAAILHDPEILILDEPTSGLDPNQIAEVRELIHRMGQTKTVILSTHILPEVEASCGRAVILIDGRVRADGTLGELTRSRSQVVSVAPGDPAEARRLFEGLRGVDQVRPDGVDGSFHTYRLRLTEDRQIGEEVAELARQRGWALRELRRDDKTLEQVFRELTASAPEVTA
jgi:ABC-2 type transport system ATP-binding protein